MIRKPRTIREVKKLMESVGPIGTSVLAISDYLKHRWLELPSGISWCCRCGILKVAESRYFVYDKTFSYAVDTEPQCPG